MIQFTPSMKKKEWVKQTAERPLHLFQQQPRSRKALKHQKGSLQTQQSNLILDLVIKLQINLEGINTKQEKSNFRQSGIKTS